MRPWSQKHRLECHAIQHKPLYSDTANGVIHTACAYHLFLISLSCTRVATRQQKRQNHFIFSLLWGGVIIYLLPEVTQWFMVAVLFACQTIKRDNLALVMLHYSRKWNTINSCVTPLWSKQKARAQTQCRVDYCHKDPEQLQTSTGGSTCQSAQNTWETTGNRCDNNG